MRTFVWVLIAGLFLTFDAAAQFARTDSRLERDLQRLRVEVDPLYRKPTAKELKIVEPDAALRAKYATFLKLSETGITKLIVDQGCAVNTQVISANENCLKYSMPGAGSSFSFRTKSYRIPRIGDITFTDRSFQSLGTMQLGIFVNLGNVPIENAGLATRGMAYLNAFVPEMDFENYKKAEAELTRGVVSDGFAYRRGFFIAENSTYALRSIAYDGQMRRTVNGLTYNELDFDRRRDITVVIRVVDKDADGNITILWRILADKKSPELKKKTDE